VTKIATIIAVGILLATTPTYAQGSLPAGHADAGAVVFKKCMACHQLGPSARNGVGPVLNGVVGRSAGTYPSYNYSPATKNAGLVWDEQTLARYLRAPRELVPGTRMSFIGLKKDQEVADVIAYLRRFDVDGEEANR
jgi:cytochrome c